MKYIMWLLQDTSFDCFSYLLASGWRRTISSCPHCKTSSLIRSERWVTPKKCKLYERTPLLLGFSVASQHNLHFVHYIMPLLQNVLICDILLTYWILNTLILTFMDSLVYVMVCRYCFINEGKDLSTAFSSGWRIASGHGVVCSANIQSIDGSIKHANMQRSRIE